MRAYRIARRKWAESRSGSGIAGRWNQAGASMLYTSSSLALALLEVLVHVKLDQIPDDYVWVLVEFDRELVVELTDVPKDPAEYGTKWLQAAKQGVILSVPSVIVPETNFLINPDHTNFVKIVWHEPQPLQIDPRLLRQ